MKHALSLPGPEESSISTRSWSIKQLKNEEIYHNTDNLNFRSFCPQIESGSEGWNSNKRYKETKWFLDIKEVDFWNDYRMRKNTSEDKVALKDFLDRL